MAIATHDLQFQIIHLSAAHSGLECIRQRTDVAGSSQFQEGTAKEFAMFEPGFEPAPIGVADESGSIGDQDEALRVAKNLAGEIALAVQFRLICVNPGDVEHQSANLHQAGQGCHTCRRH